MLVVMNKVEAPKTIPPIILLIVFKLNINAPNFDYYNYLKYKESQ
jgi:hypothetical protein